MEDRRNTEPWVKASSPRETEATVARARSVVADHDDERVRGLTIKDRFRIDECIGIGGMSRVYVGQHLEAGSRVAIKLIEPGLSRDPVTRQRLLAEARAMMELKSNHIVQAYDTGTLPSGQLYVVMEYLIGENLDDLLTREGPLPWPRVVELGLQICAGLATAHRGKIIHRDIKPQNCFLTTVDGNRAHVKIIDFGVARESSIDVGSTEQGILPGTPEYMAPELVSRPGTKADERTDIYAVGVTLYKILVGHLPFKGPTYMDTLRLHVRQALVPPSQAAPSRGIPPEADAVLTRALAKQPEQRFASADDLAEALRASVGRGVDPTVQSLTQPRIEHPPEPATKSGDPWPLPGLSPVDARRAASASGPANGGHDLLPPPTANSADAHPGFLPPSSPVPPSTVQVPASSPSSTSAPATLRPVTASFVLLRATTLLLSSALFAVGTFLVIPRLALSEPATLVPESVTLAPSAEEPVAPAEPLEAPARQSVPTPVEPALPTKVLREDPTTADAPIPIVEAPPDGSPVKDTTPPEVTHPEPKTIKPETSNAGSVPAPQLKNLETTQSEPTKAPLETPPIQLEPEPGFNYNAARKLIEEQLDYIRKECIGKRSKKSLGKLTIRADVRASGRAAIRVFWPEKDVRSCVRDLYKFPFFASPRGGAFEYTVTASGEVFMKKPVDPEYVK